MNTAQQIDRIAPKVTMYRGLVAQPPQTRTWLGRYQSFQAACNQAAVRSPSAYPAAADVS
jgi:hypothetical protein